MLIVGLAEIRRRLDLDRAIASMREAVLAQSRGECDTPMPMHLHLPDYGPEAEIHIKSSYRKAGAHFVIKMAGTFPGRVPRGLLASTGVVLLFSAATGEAAAFFDDQGHLTDVRTAAVAAMVAKELRRDDRILGILGTGVQARLEALLHSRVLPLEEVWLWGRSPDRVAACLREIAALLPGVKLSAAESPSEVARRARLIVTATASRAPLLAARDLRPGTHLSAVGSDSPGKQELDTDILRGAALLLVDSLSQCERLGELQHAPSEAARSIEVGAFCERPVPFDRNGITVCDFTGLGVEDLFIAESCYREGEG